MAIDLEKTRVDVEAHLQEKGIPVFFGYDQMADGMIHVTWDTEKHPDFRDFVATASHAGVKLMVFHAESFSESSIGRGSRSAGSLRFHSRRKTQTTRNVSKPCKGTRASPA